MESLFHGALVNVIIDYGKQLDSDLKLEIDSCSLVSTTQTLPLVSNRQIDEDSVTIVTIIVI